MTGELLMAILKRTACVDKSCVACGRCVKECTAGAISMNRGVSAAVNEGKCLGCGKCVRACPAGVIAITPDGKEINSIKEHWYDYLWIFTGVYLALGFFNILFAWIGLLCFIVPLLISIIGGSKVYCNKYCGRGQLLELTGGDLGLSRKRNPPKFLRSAWFRYGFLTFFMTMFMLMIYNTYLVFAGASLKEAVTFIWMFKLPWNWTNTAFVSPWIAQFAFGFYGVMLTSTVLGMISMIVFKPRSWCVFCPMGTMTQGICKIRNKKEKQNGKKSKTNSGVAESFIQREQTDDILRIDGTPYDGQRNFEACSENNTAGAVSTFKSAQSSRDS
jgi:NAD-dependent dihydropyrimidine dehydrogenase PreA subunit